MRTKHFSKIFLVAIVVGIGFTTCDIDRGKYEKQCLDQEHIKLRDDKISISFAYKYDSLSLNTVQLVHIRDGHVSELSHTRNGANLDIGNVDLLTRDTIIVRTINPRREFILHDFKNSPSYGGKNFLGCHLFLFKVNGKDSVLEDWSRIHIPNDQKQLTE